MEFLKKASRTPAKGEDDTRKLVADMLADIEQGGEDRARHHAEKLDGWTGDIVVPESVIEEAGAQLSQRVRDDIGFAHARVRAFAEAQMQSMVEFETELSPGLVAGQRLITLAKLHTGELGPLDWLEQRSLTEGAAAFDDLLRGRSAAPKIVLRP